MHNILKHMHHTKNPKFYILLNPHKWYIHLIKIDRYPIWYNSSSSNICQWQITVQQSAGRDTTHCSKTRISFFIHWLVHLTHLYPSCTRAASWSTSTGRCSSCRWCTFRAPTSAAGTASRRGPGTPSGPTSASPGSRRTWPPWRPRSRRCGSHGRPPRKGPCSSPSSPARPAWPSRLRSRGSSRASWAGWMGTSPPSPCCSWTLESAHHPRRIWCLFLVWKAHNWTLHQPTSCRHIHTIQKISIYHSKNCYLQGICIQPKLVFTW